MTEPANNFTFSVIQHDIIWEDVRANLDAYDKMISRLDFKVDLVIFPETFTTGFTMRSTQFAADGERALQWMKSRSAETGAVFTGSVIKEDSGKVYNRMYWVTPDGDVTSYDKRHLFRMGGEDRHFTQGNRRVITSLKGVRFILQICYDLRFPVFVRNREDYDAIIYVTNWPAPRHAVYETLLKARAIENQAYVIGVNRSGSDGEGISYKGGSMMVDPKGNVTASLGEEPGVLYGQIDPASVHVFRESFPVYRDADRFTLDF